MSKLKIEINLDNTAYEDDLPREMQRNLDQVLYDANYLGESSGFIRDINGNTTGCWAITED